ncbi:MAG: antitoxin [bacterium]
MNSISITELKTNPAAAFFAADDYPVPVMSRNSVRGYVVGKDLFEKMLLWMEDKMDADAIKNADFSTKTDFEEFAKELGV